MMIGVLRPPKSSRFQSRLLPSPDPGLPLGLIVAGSPVSREMLLPSGPRQYGQSSGSISIAQRAGQKVVQTSVAADRASKGAIQGRFMADSRAFSVGRAETGSGRAKAAATGGNTTIRIRDGSGAIN